MRSFMRGLVGWALLGMAGAARASSAGEAKGVEFFESRVRPVLVAKCYSCHSASAEKVKGEFLLDSRAGLLRGGASKRPAVTPGEPEKSPLIHAVRGDDPDSAMPPKGDGLTKAEVADFVAWVKAGAPDPRVETAKTAGAPPAGDSAEARAWWSIVPVKDVAPSQTGSAARVSHPIDKFIAAKLDEQGLTPVGPASREALIRRATFDLTGLPPTPADVEAFVADASPDAFDKVIDRLLASPAYGERWGRHWLDVVRYADTAGESADYPVPQAYLYRNYVIDAFNRDTPYDRFLTEQVAGDLLPARDDAERQKNVIATGFLAVSRRFAVDPENVMHLTYDDTLDTLGKGVLGLTVACARCHDHKFDPISAADYYALYGVLASTKYPYPGSETTKFQKDMVVLGVPPDVAERYKAYSAEVAAINDRINKLKHDDLVAPDDAARKKARAAMDVENKALKAKMATAPEVPSAYAVQEGEKIADARIFKRGEPGQPGETVRRGFLKVLGGQKLPDGYKGSGRLELAKWLTDPANPLTARVMVNRIWQHHFGQGIVRTPSDFGRRGERPTHPELLDFLAKRFVEGGWSVKAMHKLVMTSAAYQRSSAADAKVAERDAGNAYLWHFERRRIDAEELRDAVLFVSGDLDATVPAGHPFPPMKQWNWTQHNPYEAAYPTRHRSVYLMQQRLKKQPFLAMFDGADPNASTADRTESTTPLQALYMMNDRFVFEQSDKLATRLMKEWPDPAGRAGAAVAMSFGRRATGEEVVAAVAFMTEYRARLRATTKVPPADHERAALAAYVRAVLCSNEFFYLD